MVTGNWPYHVKIDGEGYLLELDDQGRPSGGVYREDYREPWTQRWSAGPTGYSDMGPWSVQAWDDFSGGIGASREDGSKRYWAGYQVDTRTGRAMPGILLNGTQEEDGLGYWEIARDYGLSGVQLDNFGVSAYKGYGERFVFPLGWGTVKNVLLCLGMQIGDVLAAGTFTVAIYADVSGVPGGAALGSTTVNLEEIKAWGEGSFAPVWVQFASPVSMTPGNQYWITVTNDQAYTMWWARSGLGATRTQAYWDGAVWTARTDQAMFWLAHEPTLIDGPPVFLIEYVNDEHRRLVLGVEHKVLYWDEDHWVASKTDFAQRVTSAVVFKEKLWVAQGDGAAIYDWDMTTWTAGGTNHADVLGVHDNMIWRAEGREVRGSGAGATWGNAVDVGGGSAKVRALTSHGGKLYAATQDGIWEINYPSGYPASGDPSANLVIPLPWGEHNGRFLVEWQQGLYFPAMGSLWEWKNNNIRDIWRGRLDEEEPQIWFADRNLSRRAVIERGAVGWAGNADSGIHFTAAHGLEREILALRSPEVSGAGMLGHLEVVAWDGHGWHPIGQWATQGAMGHTMWRTSDRWGCSGQLWIGALHDVARANISSWYEDRRYDAFSLFPTKYELVLPEFDGGTKTVRKDWQQVIVSHSHFLDIPNTKIEVHYRMDPEPDTAWVLAGSLTAPSDEIVTLPAGSLSRRVQIKLEVSCPYGQLPPGVWVTAGQPLTIEAVELWFQQMPPQQRQYQMVLRVGDKLELLDGKADGRSAVGMLSHLRGLNTRGEPFTLVDLYGVEHEVRRSGMAIHPSRIRSDRRNNRVDVESRVVLTLVDAELDVAGVAA